MSLIVVAHAEQDARYRCRICGALFSAGLHSAYEHHVVACSQRNDDGLRARSLRHRMPGLFDPASFDVEFEAWVAHHAQDILQGRRRLK
jgi:hypothetical protein